MAFNVKLRGFFFLQNLIIVFFLLLAFSFVFAKHADAAATGCSVSVTSTNIAVGQSLTATGSLTGGSWGSGDHSVSRSIVWSERNNTTSGSFNPQNFSKRADDSIAFQYSSTYTAGSTTGVTTLHAHMAESDAGNKGYAQVNVDCDGPVITVGPIIPPGPGAFNVYGPTPSCDSSSSPVLTVSWDASTPSGGTVSYVLKRNDGRNFNMGGRRSYADSSVITGRRYNYEVVATDANGSTNGTPDPTPTVTAAGCPPQPFWMTQAKSTCWANFSVNQIAWSQATGATTYFWERWGGPYWWPTYISYTTPDASTTNWDNTSLFEGNVGPWDGYGYTYRITAINAYGSANAIGSTTVDVTAASCQTISGKLYDVATLGPVGVLSGVNTCAPSIWQNPLVKSDGTFTRSNMNKGDLYCVRAPAVTGYTPVAPSEWEWQVAGMNCKNSNDPDYSSPPCIQGRSPNDAHHLDRNSDSGYDIGYQLNVPPPTLTVSCGSTGVTGYLANWQATINGGSGTYTVNWSGDDVSGDGAFRAVDHVSGAGKVFDNTSYTYTTTGTKNASIVVSDGIITTSPTLCYPSANVIGGNPPPQPTATLPACINNGNDGAGITYSWGAVTPYVTWVDVSNDNFTTYYHKFISSGTSTTGNGFTGTGSISGQNLTYNPGTTYSVRTFNTNGNSPLPNTTFLVPACSSGSDTTPPTAYGQNTLASCYTSSTWSSANISAIGFDNAPVPPDTSSPSDVNRVEFRFTDQGYEQQGGIFTGIGNPPANYQLGRLGVYTLNTAANPPPGQGTYVLQVRVIDNANNNSAWVNFSSTGNPPNTFQYQSACNPNPFFSTTGGDVHSNQDIKNGP